MVEDQIRRLSLQDPLSESHTDQFQIASNKDIQFGYHSAAGKNIQITNNGLGAERMNPEDELGDGVAYGAQSLINKGLSEFEVKIVSYEEEEWIRSIRVGVMRFKKGAMIKSGPGIPENSCDAGHHYMWANVRLHNALVTPKEYFDYGYVDLDDLREGDCVGLRLSRDGMLEFTVNGESQGMAAKNIYTSDTDVYAVVDHYARCVATVITKAGEC